MLFKAHRLATAASALAVSAALAPAASADGSSSLSRIALDGNRIIVTAHCTTATAIQVDAGARSIGNDEAACRDRTARARFPLTTAARKRLTGSRAPEVQVRVAAERTTVSFRARGAEAPATARTSAGLWWARPRATCTQMSYGNPPYSLYTMRHVAIEQAGETFGYRVSTLLTTRGLFWVEEPNGAQYWATSPWTDTFAGTSGAGFTLPLYASARVRPAIQLYNGEWNWVNVTWAPGATVDQSGRCYFAPGS